MIPYTQAKRVTLKEVSGGTSLSYQSLIMKTLPSTLEYNVGDLLSFDGMELYGIYSDGTDTFMKDVTELATPSIAEGTEITENTPTTITFSYSDGATYTVSYEITVTALPEGYTQKNYIQHSSSGQLPLEAYKPKKTDIIVADMEVPSIEGTSSGIQVGIIAVFSYTSYSGAVGMYSYTGLTTLYARQNKTSTAVALNGLDELKARCKVKIDMTGNKITVGTQVNDVTAISIPTANQYYLLFGENISSSVWAKTKIYGIKIYNSNEELVSNYIPCLNPSNRAGLFETVSKTFKNSDYWSTAG